GRAANVINSGGIKICAEQVEAALAPLIHGRFAVTAEPSVKFEQCVVLLTEVDIDYQQIKQQLPHYHVPKKVYRVDKIPLTDSGKINRAAIKQFIYQKTAQH